MARRLRFLRRWRSRRQGIVSLTHREWRPSWGVPPWGCRTIGTHRDGGYPKPSASTSTRGRGTQRQATGTGVDFNSSFRPGALSAVSLDPTLPARVNSYTVPGLFTLETGVVGVSGEPLGSAT